MMSILDAILNGLHIRIVQTANHISQGPITPGQIFVYVPIIQLKH